ncbi:hypothetical protein [Pseudonocardia cypriaca]|uniref:Uncharacterized protein n=1 Tax=Pseudonocardia cypriaca TaxID=882449 RepID=A0A543GCQ9_9PSEU|nr:hypothetical protein [Pseudonocardia cypriaca]TQM43859.1 hypothetical protein FB388_1211 [Pseudonocardia cypriaca]
MTIEVLAEHFPRLRLAANHTPDHLAAARMRLLRGLVVDLEPPAPDTAEARPVRLGVDLDRCGGHGLCEAPPPSSCTSTTTARS